MKRWLYLAVASLVAVAGAGCSRSGGSAPAASVTSNTASGSPAASTAGDFGSLHNICGPGQATGTTARGVTDTEIHVGTMADPSNTVQPGAGQEMFDIAKGFAQWCNAAGGILGRKIVVSQHDARLLNVNAEMLDACRTDFMLVGNGNVIDAPGVKPRLDCNLAQIPAYDASPQSQLAPLQVQIDASVHQVDVGAWRVLAQKYPAAFQSISLITINAPGIKSFALRQQDALTKLGYKVVNLQATPPTGVDNWRPYAAAGRSSGAKAVITTSANINAFVTSMADVGWKPEVLPLAVQNYNESTLASAKQGNLPPTYVSMAYWPFEAANQNPATQQAVKLIKASSNLKPDFAHLEALNAWLLWAVSAKACGSHLTGTCVINQAAAQQDWSGGGLMAPVNLRVGEGILSHCFVLVKATADGFQLAPEVTKPNNKIFNCSPGNVVTVANTHLEG